MFAERDWTSFYKVRRFFDDNIISSLQFSLNLIDVLMTISLNLVTRNLADKYLKQNLENKTWIFKRSGQDKIYKKKT